jgi:hypothetical protein
MLDMSLATVSGCPRQTRSLRSGGFIRSRSTSELLLTQKTKLPRLTTVCLGQPDTDTNLNGKYGIITCTKAAYDKAKL